MRRIDKIAEEIFPTECVTCMQCVIAGIRQGVELCLEALEPVAVSGVSSYPEAWSELQRVRRELERQVDKLRGQDL